MLARSFKTAAELNIPEDQYQALLKTLDVFETDSKLVWTERPDRVRSDVTPKFDHLFNMNCWNSTFPCGTISCIGGSAELISGIRMQTNKKTIQLHNLFYPYEIHNWNLITPEIATQALRNYLTRGRAMWETLLPLSKFRPDILPNIIAVLDGPPVLLHDRD